MGRSAPFRRVRPSRSSGSSGRGGPVIEAMDGTEIKETEDTIRQKIAQAEKRAARAEKRIDTWRQVRIGVTIGVIVLLVGWFSGVVINPQVGYFHRPPPDDFVRHAVWLNQPGPPTDLDLINADSSRTDDILVGAVPDTTARWWLCFTSRASDVTSIVQVADYGGAVLSLSDGPPFRQATRVLRNEKTATYCHPDNPRGYVGALFSRPTVWRMVRLDGDR